MKLTINLQEKSYDIFMERGILQKLSQHVDLDRKVLILSDDGVPKQYVDQVLAQCPRGYSHVVRQGEGAKSLEVYKEVCERLLELGFSRTDCILALGGGVIGDLAGFVAATYLRGISFVGIPTTTLSQIDSSIGGKVAVNLDCVKNVLGSFYHPSRVLIDPDTLRTLPRRHFVNGLAEAIKAGLIGDPAILDLFEQPDVSAHVEEIIFRSLQVKKAVVEQDEKEQNLRRILNFGHTLGHGIESVYGLKDLLHGECVALGMLPMLEDDALRQRVEKIYVSLGLRTGVDYDPEKVYQVMTRDKKVQGGRITVVKVKEAGHARLETSPWKPCGTICVGRDKGGAG